MRFLVVALAVILAACDSTPEPATRESRALPVQAWEVAPRDLVRRVEVSAPVTSLHLVELAAQAEGVITGLAVEAGDTVQAGDVLVTLDTREAEAELARAESAMREARANFTRLASLQESGHVDVSSVEVARRERDAAEAEVELWRTRVDYGTVRAPLDALVTARHVEPGEAVNRFQTLLSLADSRKLVVRLGVSELDVEGLLVGAPVLLHVDALRNASRVPGAIRRVLPAVEGASRLVTVEVELDPAAADRVRLGYLARADLLVDQRAGVLSVPVGSVARRNGRDYVMVINGDDELERRDIEPGVTIGNWREVRGGLERGEYIITANPAELQPGQSVRVVSRLGEDS